MDEQRVLALIEDGDTAYSLLNKKHKKALPSFHKCCDQLSELLKEVQKTFPDAQYYSANGVVNLMLGNSHDASGEPQGDLVAFSSNSLDISGGDW